MPFRSTKSYGHELGLSACFRQWRADSHCRLLHGYALSFKFVFEAEKRDANNWVLDFGSLKPLKEALVAAFDHKLVLAKDDPAVLLLSGLEEEGLADVVVIGRVGCEAFAELGWQFADGFLFEHKAAAIAERGLRVISCECAEHGANSAIYSIE